MAWKEVDNRLTKTFKFRDFNDSLADKVISIVIINKHYKIYVFHVYYHWIKLRNRHSLKPTSLSLGSNLYRIPKI